MHIQTSTSIPAYAIYIYIGLVFLSSVEALTEYIIYPKRDLESPSWHALENLIKSLMRDPKRLYASINPSKPGLPNFWLANLETPAFERLSKEPNVFQIHPNAKFPHSENIKSKRATPRIITQKKPPIELRVISQPPVEGTTIDNYPDYVWPWLGEETFIYDIGEGVNTAHQEFTGRKIEWLYPPVAAFRGTNTPTEDPKWGKHQTCTASKAVGTWAGSSKTSTLVIVKIPDDSEDAFNETFQTILNDIRSKKRGLHSVVNYSYAIRIRDDPEYQKYACWGKMAADMDALMKMGVIITTGAGNDGPKQSTGFPATLADDLDTFRNKLIVTGAVDFDGNKAEWSEELKHSKMLWAPGVDIFCADQAPSKTGYREVDGTSFSGPLVAGAIAQLLPKLNTIVQSESRGEYIMNHFKWNRPNGLPIIWNRMTPPQQPISQGAPSGSNITATVKKRGLGLPFEA